MRVVVVLATIAMVSSAAAEEVTLEQLWAVVQAQQAQIEALTDALEITQAQLESTEAQVEVAEEQIGLTADYLTEIEASSTRGSRTHLGGYGELHYNNVDARDPDQSFKEMDFHRFVLFFSHEFTDRIRFHSELELEHSLVKDTADGSNGGEVELEQADQAVAIPAWCSTEITDLGAFSNAALASHPFGHWCEAEQAPWRKALTELP